MNFFRCCFKLNEDWAVIHPYICYGDAKLNLLRRGNFFMPRSSNVNKICFRFFYKLVVTWNQWSNLYPFPQQPLQIQEISQATSFQYILVLAQLLCFLIFIFLRYFLISLSRSWRYLLKIGHSVELISYLYLFISFILCNYTMMCRILCAYRC